MDGQGPTGMKNSNYVCGISVHIADNYNNTRNKIYDRIKFHSKSTEHTVACSYTGSRNAAVKKDFGEPISLAEIEENEEKIEENQEKIDEKIEENQEKIEENQEKIEENQEKIEENQAIYIDPTEQEKMINYIDQRLKTTIETGSVGDKNDPPRNATTSPFEKIVNYIETRLKPRYPWLQLSEGKVFCTVRNMLLALNAQLKMVVKNHTYCRSTEKNI